MKRSLLALFAFATSLAFLTQSCNDDSSNPTGNGGNNGTGKTCKMETVTDEDGYETTYTFSGDQLVKVEEEDEFGTYTTNYIYQNDQVTLIIEDGDTTKLTYTGNMVTKVEEIYEGSVTGFFEVEYNGNDKISKATYYDVVSGMNEIYENYIYTWSGNNVTKIENNYDDDGDGTLESTLNVTFSSYDDKKNPYYDLPLKWLELDFPVSFSMNNMLKGSMTFLTVPLDITSTYEYNSDGYPTKITTTLTGFGSGTATVSYMCE